MKKIFAFTLSLLCFLSDGFSQSGIIGAGFAPGWTNSGDIQYLSSSAGASYIITRNPSGTGNQYFRLIRNNTIEMSPSASCTPGQDQDVSASGGSKITINNAGSCTNGAWYINCPNTTDNYIFKVSSDNSSADFVFFRVQGTVQTVSSVAQSPLSANVFPGQTVTVTANLSASFSTGQSVYMRYTTDGWTSSTITEMTGGPTTYTADITASATINTPGQTISYYCFTSGNGLTIAHADADYFAINLNNNGGGNYSYTVQSGWVSAATGNWSAAPTWTGNAVPSASLSMGTVTIAHDVTMDQNATMTTLSVSSGKTLTINSGITLTTTSSGSTTINGTVNNAGTITYSGGGQWTFSSTGKYQHNYTTTAGTVPTATWNAGSTCEIIGYTTNATAPSGRDQTFSNFTWNCANQTANLNFSGTVPTVNGDFNFTTSNTGIVRLSASTNYTLTVGGTFAVSAGTLVCATTTATGTINISGNYSQTGGTFDLANGGAATITVNISANFSNSATNNSFKKTTGTATAKIVFNKSSGTQTFSSSNISSASNPIDIEIGTGSTNNNVSLLSDIAIHSSATLTVFSGSTLSMGANVITGGTFTANSGSTLQIGSTAGITSSGATGNVQTTTRNFNTGANYVYNGTASQASGNGLPTTVNTLTTACGGGNTVTLTNSGTLIISSASNSLILTSGSFSVGSANTISIPSGGTVSAGSGDFASGSSAGTVSFAGAGTISGTINNFYNVTLAGGVDFGAASTVNNILQINAGGWVNTNAPTYAAASTLKYNTGGTFGRSAEWSATVGAGYPYHVQISNSTTLDLGNGGTGTARQCAGNLTIDDGSAFSMNVTAMTAALTVIGNVVIGGGTSGTLTLSGSAGGDIVVKGNITLSAGATFIANARRVTLNGTSSQNITGSFSGASAFAYMTVDNSAGGTISNDIAVDNELRITTGTLDLNGSNNITIASAATLVESAGNLIKNTGSPSAGNGYIQITKNLNAPSSDNTGGLGAIITTASNMGNTNIKRFHKPVTQTGLGGAGASLKRYYLISPTSTGSSATLVYSYDNTELNGNSESPSPTKLHLYNSTSESSGYTSQGSSSTDAGANTTTQTSLSVSTTPTFWTAATNGYATASSNNWSNTATWTSGVVPPSGDNVVINHTVTIDMDPTCSSVTVNTGKILQYENTTTVRTLTVTGDVTVNGTFKTGPQTSAVTHKFILGGNLIVGDIGGSNEGDFVMTNTTFASVKTETTFNGSSDVTISSPGTPYRVEFGKIIILKGGTTNKVTYNISTINPELPGSDTAISFRQGRWEQNTGTINFGTNTHNIPVEGSAGGGLQVTGSGSATFNGSINMRHNGVFTVNTSGAVTVGDASGEGFLMDGSAGLTYTVTFQSGTVNIAGRIGSISGAPGNVWKGTITISGATVNVPAVGLSNANDCVFCVPASNATFNMSSGTLNIMQANQGGYAGADLDIDGTTSSITGGTIVIGNGGSSGSLDIDVSSSEDLNLLRVNSGTVKMKLRSNINVTNSASPLTINSGGIDLNTFILALNASANGVTAITIDGGNRNVISSGGAGYLKITSGLSTDVKSMSYTNSGGLTILDGAVMQIGTCSFNFSNTSASIIENNGTLEMLTSGSVQTAASTFNTGSTLKYSPGGSYDRNVEWNTPYHVIVTNTTTLQLGNQSPALALTMNGNLTIDAASVMNWNSKTAALTVGGNVSNSGTITLSDQNAGDLKLLGSFDNDGTFNCAERAVYFQGTAVQTVSGNNAINIDYLRMENSGGGSVTLSRLVSVDNEISFTSGIITSTSANLLVFNGDCSIANAADNGSHVNGPVEKIFSATEISGGSFTFPIGKNADYQAIKVSSLAGSANDAFTAEYFASSPAPTYDANSKDASIDHISDEEYWILNRATGTPNAVVEITFDANSGGITSLPDLIVARWDAGVAKWKDHTNACTTCWTGDVNNGTAFTDAAVASFSPFTFGSKIARPGNPLPVELVDFSAECENNSVVLNWITSSEINSDYFTVEKSSDGEIFKMIGKIKDAGNSSTIKKYFFVDESQTINRNTKYYRLKQTDIDGKSKYFDTVSVACHTKNQTEIYSYSQNEIIFVHVNSTEEKNWQLKIFNVLGQTLAKKDLTCRKGSNYFLIDDLQHLPPQIVFITLVNETENHALKLLFKQ